MKLWNDYGVRANLATISVAAFFTIVIIAMVTIVTTIEQALAVIGVAQPVALLGLRWYFEKKKEGV